MTNLQKTRLFLLEAHSGFFSTFVCCKKKAVMHKKTKIAQKATGKVALKKRGSQKEDLAVFTKSVFGPIGGCFLRLKSILALNRRTIKTKNNYFNNFFTNLIKTLFSSTANWLPQATGYCTN